VVPISSMPPLLIVLLALLLPGAESSSSARAGPSCAAGDQQHCCISASRIAQLTNTTTADECCELCGADPRCGAYCFYAKEGRPTCNHFKSPESAPYQCQGTGECISGQTWHPAPQPPSPPAPPGAKNLLYFMVDDLRTALGGRHPHMALTPHLDRLAADGATFTHAYCNHAVCAPSRDSFMVNPCQHSGHWLSPARVLTLCTQKCAEWAASGHSAAVDVSERFQTRACTSWAVLGPTPAALQGPWVPDARWGEDVRPGTPRASLCASAFSILLVKVLVSWGQVSPRPPCQLRPATLLVSRQGVLSVLGRGLPNCRRTLARPAERIRQWIHPFTVHPGCP
jgi:hypothetical protein